MDVTKTTTKRLKLGAALWLIVGAWIVPAWSQDESFEPRWFSMRITDAYLKFDAEAEQQTIASQQNNVTTTLQRLYLAPGIGVGAAGSIYHPNFFQFDLTAEPGYAWQNTSYGGSAGSLDQTSLLQNYRGKGTLFGTKPFMTTFSANQSHNFIEYDIFNQAVSDSQSFGVATGYREGPVPVSIAFEQSHQDATSLSQHTIFDTTTLDLTARNERGNKNVTDLTYRFGQYDQSIESLGTSVQNNNTYQFATLSDVEHFGRNDRFTLSSSVNFDELDSPDLPSRNVVAQSGLIVQHTPELRSLYDYSLTWYSDNASDYQQHFGRAGLSHQLYQSLVSSVDVHGGLLNATTAGSTLEAQSAGAHLGLNYTKRLGAWGRLTLGNSANFDLIDQTTSGGRIVVIETAVLTPGVPTPLKQPNAVSVVSVTMNNGTQPLTNGVDYVIYQNSNPWEIQPLVTSLFIPNGGTVQIVYLVDSNPSGSYSTFQDLFQIRLDLFDRLLGFYSRLTVIDNFTNSPGFVLDDVFETQSGAEFVWHGLHLGADYTERNATLYSYRAKGLSEGYSLQASSDSFFSLDLHQRWIDYPAQQSFTAASQSQEATYYDIVARYQWHPTGFLTWTVESGFQRQRGRGLDQDLLAARTHLEWILGKLTLNLGYDFERQDFSGELLQRHFVSLRARRQF